MGCFSDGFYFLTQLSRDGCESTVRVAFFYFYFYWGAHCVPLFIIHYVNTHYYICDWKCKETR